jgi:beta-N-acetylhexosaminidase
MDAGCDLVLACFPDVVEQAIAAIQQDVSRSITAALMPPQLAALRGALGASWDGLLNNPQRDRFVARITALNADQGNA